MQWIYDSIFAADLGNNAWWVYQSLDLYTDIDYFNFKQTQLVKLEDIFSGNYNPE